MENKNISILWSLPEYEHKEQTSDWFWALGIIVVASAGTAIIFGNYFFGILLILAGLLIGFFAVKEPARISYEINNNGLLMRDKFYRFKDMKSFFVSLGSAPLLLIRSDRFFMPIIEIPIEKEMAKEIREVFLNKQVPEEEMKEPVAIKIMETFGL